MEYFDLIEQRYSVRSYKPDKVEREKLDNILKAGVFAPTAANRQAFKIYVIETAGREEELKQIYNKDWFVEAPLLLGVCSIPGASWVRRDNKNYADVDAAIVMDHIVLAAASQGLGTCWVAAFDPAAAKRVLKLDDSLEAIAFTPVGYVREANYRKVRKSVDELVVYI